MATSATTTLFPARLTVDGSGSTWLITHDLHVGFSGSGTLNITNGGYVLSSFFNGIGYNAGSAGVVAVDNGAGSQWCASNGFDLYVGYSQVGYNGRGTLNVTGGGTVTTSSVRVAFPVAGESLLAINVGNGSLLDVGNGSGPVTGNGTVRILASASPTAGTPYTPISAGSWSGSGTYQPVGGM